MLKKIAIAIALTIGLSGCAQIKSGLDKIDAVWTVATSVNVSSRDIIVAANGFNGVKSLATLYLGYCKDNLTVSICSADNRRYVIRSIRLGTDYRNRLESYAANGGAGPSDLYNLLVGIVVDLKNPAKSPLPAYSSLSGVAK